MANGDDTPDFVQSPIEQEAWDRAGGDYADAQRIITELRNEEWEPEGESNSTARQPDQSGPPGGSETTGQPRDSGSDKLTDEPVDTTPRQPIDQQEPEDEEPRQPVDEQPPTEDTSDEPRVSDPTPPPSEPRVSDPTPPPEEEPSPSETEQEDDTQRVSDPTPPPEETTDTPQSDLEGVNLNDLSPERARELIGEDSTFGQTRYDSVTTSVPLDEQRQQTGSPVRPSDPRVDADATLQELAGAVSNPTIDTSTTAEARLAQLSPLALRGLGLSGGEIRAVSPGIDTADDLGDASVFRQEFGAEEAREYQQQQAEELQQARRGAPQRRQDEPEQVQEQLETIEQEAAARFDEQFATVDIGVGDVQLERDDGEVTPQLRPGIQRQIQTERLQTLQEETAQQISEQSDVDLTAEDIQLDYKGGFQTEVGESGQEKFRAQRREEVVSALDEQLPGEITEDDVRLLEFGTGFTLTDEGESTVQQARREQQREETVEQFDDQLSGFGITREDVRFDDGEAELTPQTQREYAAQQVRLGPIEGLERQTEALTSESVSLGESRLLSQITADDVTLQDGQAQLDPETRTQLQEYRAVTAIDQQFSTDVDIGDVSVEDGGVQVSEQARREEAAQQFGESVDTSDVTLQDGQAQLTDEYRKEQAQEPLSEQLAEQTGLDDATVPTSAIVLDDGQARISESYLDETREALAESQEQQGFDPGEGDVDLEGLGENVQAIDQQPMQATQANVEGGVSYSRTRSGEYSKPSAIDIAQGAGRGIVATQLAVRTGVERAVSDPNELGESVIDTGQDTVDSAQDILSESQSGQAAAAFAPVAVAEPTPVGEVGVAGLAALAGGTYVASQLFDQDSEIQVPEGEEPFLEQSELAIGSTTAQEQSELPIGSEAVPQQELPVGSGFKDITEISIPGQFGSVDPRTLQTGATVGGTVTDDTPFSPGTTLPSPGEIDSGVSEEQIFERSFPTGGSAVVGRELTEEVTEPSVEETTEPELERAGETNVQTETGTGTGPEVTIPPVTEPSQQFDGGTTEPGDIGQEQPADDIQDLPGDAVTPTPNLTPGVDVPAFATPDVPATTAVDTPFDTGYPDEPGVGYPEEPGYGYPEEPGYGYPGEPGYGTPSQPPGRPPGVPIPDFPDGDNGDREDLLFRTFAEGYTVEFADPLEGFEDGQ